MPTVELEHVSKNYGQIRALRDVSLNLSEPSCIGILGPNGAGKTTLLKILTNIVKPSSGTATVNGRNPSHEPEKALTDVGALVEQPEFYPYLTARELLTFVARIKGIRKSDTEDEIKRVSGLTSITSYLDRKAGTFSRGMKQRLSLASAMIGDPEILILDEPTFGLDPKGMKETRDLIRKLNSERKRIIILSTHLIGEAQDICDRIVIMNEGIIAYDTMNSRDEAGIRIEVSVLPDHLEIPDRLAADYRIDGNSIVLKKNSNVTNSEVIEYLQNLGLRINWVVPRNDIENIYVSIVS